MGLKKKLILSGRAASGKTTLKNALCEQWGLKPEVSYTSRAMREGEVEGIDYHFVSRTEFEGLIAQGKMLEYDQFNGNYYGTTLEEFQSCDVMIMTPAGVHHASHVKNAMFVIYLNAPQSEILDRLAARHKIQSKDEMRVIHERINADNLQFKQFEDEKPWDIQVNSTMPLDLMLKQIKSYENIYK